MLENGTNHLQEDVNPLKPFSQSELPRLWRWILGVLVQISEHVFVFIFYFLSFWVKLYDWQLKCCFIVITLQTGSWCQRWPLPYSTSIFRVFLALLFDSCTVDRSSGSSFIFRLLVSSCITLSNIASPSLLPPSGTSVTTCPTSGAVSAGWSLSHLQLSHEDLLGEKMFSYQHWPTKAAIFFPQIG